MMRRPAEIAAHLLTADDRMLGALAVGAVIAEAPMTPDVSYAVVDRLERDLLAYPEHFARGPRPWAHVGEERRSRRRWLLAGIAILVAISLAAAAIFLGVGPVQAADDAVDALAPGLEVRFEPLLSDLDGPVFATGAGDGSGRLYVVEQPGRVRVASPEGALLEAPFLDIRDRVVSGGEQGLLGLAFHPAFADNGRLFVSYTRQPDGASVVSELAVHDGRADPASERVLLLVPQPFDNHNGGMIAFDREGMLLIGLGDGGSGGDPLDSGQDRASLLGKLLRIDVDAAQEGFPYGIPADNGFADDPSVAPEIHALGLRNPWRFSVDPATGDVFVGDVGEGAWEEIDVLPGGRGGQDFGWAQVEGPECHREGCDLAAHVPPVAWYGHDQGCSVVGGVVAHDPDQPLLDGVYLFGDYCSGLVWAAPAAALAAGDADPQVVGQLDGLLASFGTDDDGRVLVVDLGGRVLRVVAAGTAE